MTTWGDPFEASPADTDDEKYGAQKIRELKSAISAREELEHNFKTGTQPFHKAGKCSVLFIGTTAEITALTSMPLGGLAWDTDLNLFKRYSGSAWVVCDGAQTLTGVKTFSSFPITPSSAPTTDYQVVNKKFIDDYGCVRHSLATAGNDFLVASGAGVFVKKTIAETKALIAPLPQVFTANGTFTATSTIHFALVISAGGSGGGGSSNAGGGGGGGGARAVTIITGLTIGANITITVGIGGAGASANANGVNGSNSSFGSYLIVNGGVKGSKGVPGGGAGGAGGSVTPVTGLLLFGYDTGYPGEGGNGSNGSNGGVSGSLAPGGVGNASTGQAGANYGGGGAGGANNCASGAGANGAVVVW